MDLSKLPKMSGDRGPSGRVDTDAPQAEAALAPQEIPAARNTGGAEAIYADYKQPGVGLQVYVSLALGLIFILVGFNFARWLTATATGQAFNTGVTWTSGPNAGQPVSYFELQGYPAWTDAAFFIFGIALLLEAMAVLATVRASAGVRNAALLLAIGVSAIATLLNLGLSIFLLGKGGLPLPSLLMTAFGGYITLYLWQLRQGLDTLSSP